MSGERGRIQAMNQMTVLYIAVLGLSLAHARFDMLSRVVHCRVYFLEFHAMDICQVGYVGHMVQNTVDSRSS
jgi:hypothetical protein